tara:strand:+ start:2796 stop:3029 length:234 start_codon:yes stop_codon:yes gene_type:complete
MIDFSGTGKIQQHNINGKLCVQFFPNRREGKTVSDMLRILDEGLEQKGSKRSILIQSEKSEKKGYPVPCVLILDEDP